MVDYVREGLGHWIGFVRVRKHQSIADDAKARESELSIVHPIDFANLKLYKSRGLKTTVKYF